MCGFAGIISMQGAPVDLDALQAMTDAQHHRGPDDTAFAHIHSNKTIETGLARAGTVPRADIRAAFGFNRLSIRDLSPAGRQPMLNRAGNVLCVFNGEVYNADDYRAELESAGVAFRGTSDTEVMLALYDLHGIDGMLRRLNGMFAIVLADMAQDRFYLVRDRLGIKPLYHLQQGGCLYVASEIKAFLSVPGFQAGLDTEQLHELLLFRFVSGCGQLLSGVRAVAPATYLRAGGGRIEPVEYWRPRDTPDDGGSRSVDGAVRAVEDQLRASVARQLVSDVPVGCQLSGGIDSSLITVLSKHYYDAPLQGFSITLDDSSLTEERWIDEAAAVAGVRAHKFLLDSNTFWDRIESAAWHMDEPVAHPNSVGIHRLAEGARDHMTVFMSGEGADELFGGYARHFFAAIRPRMRPVLEAAAPWFGRGNPSRRRLMSARGRSERDWYLLASSVQDPADAAAFWPGFSTDAALANPAAHYENSTGVDGFQRLLNVDLKTYLVGLLMRQDKMTMAHSIENRVPIIDHELVDLVRGLPGRYLVPPSVSLLDPRGSIRRGGKQLLKRVAAHYFSPDFVYRRKYGFGLPVPAYLRVPRGRRFMAERILPGIEGRGLLDARHVHAAWQRLLAGDESGFEGLWVAIALELWMQLFIDRRPPGPA